MNKDFPRIITLLRKEKGFSQKKVSEDLNVSQALLSHYEKGIRECGLDFVIKLCNYYDVSSDYLLGRTPDRKGFKLTVEDIPENNTNNNDKIFKGSVLPTLNKKLIQNSISIIFDILSKKNNKKLTLEVSDFLMVCVYKIFRIFYYSNPKNPKAFFKIPKTKASAFSTSSLILKENNIKIFSKEISDKEKSNSITLSPEIISKNYPLFASSLLNLIQKTESNIILP